MNKFSGSPETNPFFRQYLPHIKNQGKGKNTDVSFTNFISYISFVDNITVPFYDNPIPTHVFPNTTRDFQSGLKQRMVKNNLLPKGSMYFDEHWAQFSTLCHPCHIDYDYIVKFETMREDAAYVLSKLGPHHDCLERQISRVV